MDYQQDDRGFDGCYQYTPDRIVVDVGKRRIFRSFVGGLLYLEFFMVWFG